MTTESDPKSNSPEDVGFTPDNRQSEYLDQVCRTIAKQVTRWGDEVVVPELVEDQGRIRFPFEQANKKLLATVDELLRLTCLDLAKKKIERPMEALATWLFRHAIRTDGNLGLQLVVARSITSAQVMQLYRDQTVDPAFRKALYADLVSRGLTKKKSK